MNEINHIFNEFRNRRNSLEMSRNEMKEYLNRFPGNTLLYGAGSSGVAFLYDLKKIGVTPQFFVDSDERKIGKKCEGIEILSPEETVARVTGDFLVIVCINTDGKRYCKSFDDALRVGGHHGVYDRLHSVGCKNVIDYTFFRRCFTIFTDEHYNAPSCSDVELMLLHEEEIAHVYEYLDDELSRETFRKIIEFRLLDDSIEVPTLPQSTQYFEEGLYHPRNDAAFIDCGAYNGISAKTFFEIQNDQFEAYYGVEPDADNYNKLKEYIGNLEKPARDKCNLANKAVWERSGELNLYTLDGPGSFIADDIGKSKVSSTTIDELLHGKKATFIKMNIEGSEKQALRGAENTIRIYKPELAIAGYHRTDDLWRIPMMIKKFRDDYILNLRSYMNHMSFVYYAR